MFRRFAGLILTISALACAANSFPSLSLAELVSQSEVIVSGRVTRSFPSWDAEHKFIWTHTVIKTDGFLKGGPQSFITISEPGGSADGVSMQIAGSTGYLAGEQVHVFLYRTPLGYMRTTGYGQGKFTVSNDGRVHVNARVGGVKALDGVSSSEFRARVSGLVAK